MMRRCVLSIITKSNQVLSKKDSYVKDYVLAHQRSSKDVNSDLGQHVSENQAAFDEDLFENAEKGQAHEDLNSLGKSFLDDQAKFEILEQDTEKRQGQKVADVKLVSRDEGRGF